MTRPAGWILLLAACGVSAPRAEHTWPPESYVEPPRTAFEPGELVIRRDHMTHFYDVPGEFGWVAEGADYGFTGVSIITVATEPGGGPPLHTHATEEAHVLPPGAQYRVRIGSRTMDVSGPAIVRIPSGAPHTFVNIGDQPLHLVGILPGPRIDYTELGPNPLISPASLKASATPVARGDGDTHPTDQEES